MAVMQEHKCIYIKELHAFKPLKGDISRELAAGLLGGYEVDNHVDDA